MVDWWVVGRAWSGVHCWSVWGCMVGAHEPCRAACVPTPHTTVLLRYMESSRTPSGILFVVVGVARGLV